MLLQTTFVVVSTQKVTPLPVFFNWTCSLHLCGFIVPWLIGSASKLLLASGAAIPLSLVVSGLASSIWINESDGSPSSNMKVVIRKLVISRLYSDVFRAGFGFMAHRVWERIVRLLTAFSVRLSSAVSGCLKSHPEAS